MQEINNQNKWNNNFEFQRKITINLESQTQLYCHLKLKVVQLISWSLSSWADEEHN